jgi:hypothetical protein
MQWQQGRNIIASTACTHSSAPHIIKSIASTGAAPGQQVHRCNTAVVCHPAHTVCSQAGEIPREEISRARVKSKQAWLSSSRSCCAQGALSTSPHRSRAGALIGDQQASPGIFLAAAGCLNSPGGGGGRAAGCWVVVWRRDWVAVVLHQCSPTTPTTLAGSSCAWPYSSSRNGKAHQVPSPAAAAYPALPDAYAPCLHCGLAVCVCRC